ncbi:MAG: hypothetical protein FGM24_00805 [Candidatus Kapabacteria bacterium]|nr:hypothetical protein [Candidatus Kapabacteria bacterium]
MTNDELLAGFLDRSLSEDDLLELETRRSADPAFNNDVRQMLTVEDALKSAVPVVAIPADFLARVEDKIAAKVASSATPAATGMSTSIKVMGAALATVATAVGIFLATQQRSETTPAAERPTMSSPTAPSAAVPAPSAPAQTEQPNLQMQPIAAAPSTEEQPSAPGSANAYASASTPMIERLLRQYEGCKNSNESIRCAQLALNIAGQYRKLGEYASATVYSTDALTFARTLRVVQYEVEALGMLGRINIDRGNLSAARNYLRSAVDAGTGVDGINVEPYRQLLGSIE